MSGNSTYNADLLRNTIDSSLDMIQVFEAVRNEQDEIIDFIWILNNKASEKVYGDVINKSLLTLNPGVVEEGIFDTFKNVVETGEPDQSIRHYVHEQFDGWFQQSAVKLEDGVATTTRNITEQKMAEQRISEQAHFVRSLTDTVPAVVMLTEHPSNEIAFATRNIREVLDFDADDGMEMGHSGRLKLVHPDDTAKVNAYYSRFDQISDLEENRGSFRIKKKHGDWVWVDVRGRVFKRDEDGKVIQTLHVVFDDSENQKAAEELEQSKELLQRVIDAPNIGVAVCKAVRDEEGRIYDFVHEFINRITRETSGEDFTGELLSRRGEAGMSQIGKFIETIESGQQNDYVIHGEFNGKLNWVSFSNTSLGDDRLVHTWQDITQLKQAEQENIESRSLLQTVFDVTLNPIAYHKAVRDEQGKIIDFTFQLENREARKYAMEDRAGQLYSEAHPGIKETHVFKLYCEVADSGEPLNTEVQLSLQGSERWFHIMAAKLEDGLVATAVDITERKKSEQEIIRLNAEIAKKATEEYRLFRDATSERQSFLLGLSDALRPLSDPVHIESEATRLLREKLNAGWCYYNQFGDDQVTSTGLRDATREGLPPLTGVHDLSDVPLFLNHMKEGRVMNEPDLNQCNLLNPCFVEACFKLGMLSALAVPIVNAGRLFGVFLVADTHKRYWTDEEVTLVKEVAERTRVAVERAKAEDALRRSEEKFRKIFENIDQGFSIHELVVDESGNVTDVILQEVNEAFAQYTGIQDAQGKKVSEIVPNLEPVWLNAMTRAYKYGETQFFEGYNSDTDRWLTSQYSRIGGDGSRLLSTVFSDITERKKREQQQEFLLKLSEVLRMELTDTAALQTSALRLLAEHFKVMRAIYYEADSDNDTFTLTAQFETETTAIPLQYRLSDFSPTVAEEYRTGRTQMVTDTENEPYAENYRKLGIRSWLATPFVDSGNVVTVIGLHCRTPRNWCSEDVRLLEYFAERLYAAVKRTRAEEALRESESRLAQDLADAKLLQQFSNDVIHLDELDEIYELLLHTAADLMQSDFASVQLYSEPTETLSLVAHKNFHPESVTFWTFVSVASGSVCGEALRRQFRILVEDVETEEFATNELKIFRLSGIRAVQSTPIMSSRGKLIGMLNTQWKQPKSFSEDQFRFFDVLVRQAAEVIDRKHAECLLRQSEEKYRDLFDSMDEGYCIIQILFNEENEPYDWIFLEVNPAFEKNNGLTNAVGKTILELTPNIEPKWFEIYGRVVTTGEPNRFEEDSPAFNRWFSLFAFRVGSPGEHTVAVLFNDITRRKKAEADLRKSEEQFRQAIQDAPIPIIMHAEDGEVLQLSRTWTELTGFTLADISNFDLWLSTAYGQGADEVRSHMRSLFDGTQRTITVDFPMSTLSGEIRHWSFSASSPGTLKDGRRFIVGMAVDITDRKNHEEHLENFSLLLEQQIKERTLELQESRDRLQSIFDTTLVGMSLFAPVRDASGEITDFRIVSVNKKIEDGSGRTDLVGKLYGELFPGIKQMGLFDLMVKTLETGNPGKMDYYYPYEGIERWYSTMFVKGDDILVSTNMDITERIQAEEKIKKMERDLQLEIFRTSLSTLEEERYRISESLHNGIAQILYGIKINMSGLTFDMPQQEFDEAKAYSSKLLTEAINENRRISHELMPLTLEQFGLKSAIDDACRQLTGATKFHCRVNGLYQRMEKYLELAVYRTAQELMTNVVKHANASDCYVTIVIRPKEISIIVSDNGQGMVAVKKRKPGIGLASIRSKIKLLNGDVRIDTGPGKGTTVKVLIPKPEQNNAD